MSGQAITNFAVEGFSTNLAVDTEKKNIKYYNQYSSFETPHDQTYSSTRHGRLNIGQPTDHSGLIKKHGKPAKGQIYENFVKVNYARIQHFSN